MTVGVPTPIRNPDSLAVGDWYPRLPYREAGVVGSGTDETVVVVLLQHVRGPAGHAAYGEDWGEDIDGDAERIIRGRGVEIDVGVEIFRFLYVLFDLRRGFVEVDVAGAFADFFGEVGQVGGARIGSFVDAMAEAGDFYFVRQAIFYVLDGLGGRSGFEQHLDDVFIGAAVKGAFEGRDAGGCGGVDVGKRCGDYAGGEGGGVQFVIGVEGESDVEGSLHYFIGLVAGEGVEKVGGEAEAGIARDDRFPVAETIECRDDGRSLRHQLDGFGGVGLGRHVLGERIVQTQHRHGGAEDVHGRGFTDLLQKRGDFPGDFAMGDQLFLYCVKFRRL